MTDLRVLFDITWGMAYLLVNEGKIKSVSLRRRGNLKGVRLIHIDSVREYLNSLLKTQNDDLVIGNEHDDERSA